MFNGTTGAGQTQSSSISDTSRRNNVIQMPLTSKMRAATNDKTEPVISGKQRDTNVGEEPTKDSTQASANVSPNGQTSGLKAPVTKAVKLPWLPRKLKNNYFWQPTTSGASLMKDERGESGKRPYLGHFSVAVLDVVYRHTDLDSLSLSPAKRQKAEQSIGTLRDLLRMIEES